MYEKCCKLIFTLYADKEQQNSIAETGVMAMTFNNSR